MSMAAAGLGSFAGAWAFPLHGAEMDPEDAPTGLIRYIGMTGIVVSFIFIFMYAAIVIKIFETTSRIKEPHDVTDSDHINKENLHENTYKKWQTMYWLSVFSLIFGAITLVITNIINEGFFARSASAVANLMYTTFFFGLGASALTLAFIIGLLIVEWPKTSNPEGGKTAKEAKEDSKLYKVIPQSNTRGIIMSILFLLPVLTIFGTEYDEKGHIRTALNKQTMAE